MSRRAERLLAVVGAATILIVGFDGLTYAATGDSLLLGKLNTANGTTTVKNTGPGAALSLQVGSSSTPPLVTNGTGKVANLYADRAAHADDSTTVGGKTPGQVAAMASLDGVYQELADKTLDFDDNVVGSLELPRGRWAVSLWADLEYKPDTVYPYSNYNMVCMQVYEDPGRSPSCLRNLPTTYTITCGLSLAPDSGLTYGVPVTVFAPSRATAGKIDSNASNWFPVAITQAITVGTKQSPVSFTKQVRVMCDLSGFDVVERIARRLSIHGVRVTAMPLAGEFNPGS